MIVSVLNQKTNFEYELIIHDDCSTDDTPNIIKKYQEKYPNIIKAIFQKENQYSKGINITENFLLPFAKGKYFALCEGDDYFIDPLKLQKQYDYLESHQECTLCIHNSIFVKENGEPFRKHIVVQNLPRIISCDEVILGDGGFCSTNSIMAPLRVVKKLPAYFNYLSMDFVWQMYLASEGTTYCLNEFMSAYRVCSEGSWSSRFRSSNNDLKIALFNKIIRVREMFDLSTEYKYHSSIKEINKRYYVYILLWQYKRDELRKPENMKIINAMSITERIKFYLFIASPAIYKIMKEIAGYKY